MKTKSYDKTDVLSWVEKVTSPYLHLVDALTPIKKKRMHSARGDEPTLARKGQLCASQHGQARQLLGEAFSGSFLHGCNVITFESCIWVMPDGNFKKHRQISLE